MEKKKKLTGSFVAKVIAFFLLAVSAFTVAFSGLCTIVFMDDGYYTEEPEEVFSQKVGSILFHKAYEVRNHLVMGNFYYAKAICEGKNYDIALIEPWEEFRPNKQTAIWTTYDGSYESVWTWDYLIQFPENAIVNSHEIQEGQDYVFRVYVDPDLPETDELTELYNECEQIQYFKYPMLWVLGISILVVLVILIFLMCSAGCRNNADGIQASVFTGIPLDLYTAACGAGAVFLLIVLSEVASFLDMNIVSFAAFSAVATVMILWCTFYLRELVIRIKLGSWWRNTVIYRVLKLLKKMLILLGKVIYTMSGSFPLILNTLIFFFGISILELIGIGMFVRTGLRKVMILWFMEKAILFPIILYVAIMCKKLLEGSRALAEGKQMVSIDTSNMFGDFKECGENLNSIGQGISKAVAERMKSEHLKTELITNVSHDLKTPLTSIINYANLIAEEPSENAKITEYSEVLVRQSDRLKKLLQDLVEASKATTGNIEVDMRPCEVSVILSQALGEYQQRMEEKQLEPVVTQPEETVRIMADGRHLWRVFDNLLNNICKYAREDSRVYLSVEKRGKSIDIIFRNMSKYILNSSAEELQERFVRGDKSRHMEGNGLGLSIAKSLTELQNGRMEIVTDGDLFKVILSFIEI